MPLVTLIASRDFSYATRRLKAGELFEVSERDAKVLLGIKRATLPRQPGFVEPPPQKVIERAAEVTPPQPAELVTLTLPPDTVIGDTVTVASSDKPKPTTRRRPRARKKG